MMTRHWKGTGTRDGQRVAIYVTTTDEMVAQDLMAIGRDASLIMSARLLRGSSPRPSLEEQHADLAAGAVDSCRRRGFTVDSQISAVDAAPNRPPTNGAGITADGSSLVPILIDPLA
jgi:hypothetical protein